MNLLNPESKQFSDYISGKISQEDRTAFEASLLKDAALSKRLDKFYRLHKRAAIARRMQDLRKREMAEISHLSPQEKIKYAISKLESVEKQQHNSQVKIRKLYPYLAAAAVALLLIFAYPVLKKSLEPALDNQQLAEQYFADYEVENIMGNSSIASTSAIKKMYKSGDFQGVIDNVNLIDNPEPALKNLLAHAYYKKGDFERSAVAFEEVAQSNYSRKRNAAWNSIMSYLMLDDIETVKRKLQPILSESNHPFYKRAIQLEKELDD